MSNLAGTLSKRIRDAKNWSQQRLSEELQVSRNYIALIETGAKKPSVRLLNQLEQLLTAVDKENKGGVEEGRPDLLVHGPTGQRQTLVEVKPARGEGDPIEQLHREARRRFDYIIAATRDDPRRLGWVVEQMGIHLRKPETWEEPETPEQIARRLRLPTMGLSRPGSGTGSDSSHPATPPQKSGAA